MDRKKAHVQFEIESLLFTVADECQDVSTQEELTICCRWVVDGHSEEHFMTILHIRSLDAETLASTITSYVKSQGLNIKRLIGQGYRGAAPFSGKNTGVQGECVPFLPCIVYPLLLSSPSAT